MMATGLPTSQDAGQPHALPLEQTARPETQDELVALVGQCRASETPIYPIGGGTSLGYGVWPTRPGWGIVMTGLNRVIDYPARDMTITVEAGITMAELQRTLAAEQQRLPVDAPQGDRATLGGVIATNTSGPRRYGQGTMRDYVIGITAIDGHGTLFHGGGRVVKNVAGYDFCKLLTGSLGTVGIISQVTLKVKPIPEASAFLVCSLGDAAQAEALLADLVRSQTTPTAIEVLHGAGWQDAGLTGEHFCHLAVGFEGAAGEVAWMLDRLEQEWQQHGMPGTRIIEAEARALWDRLMEFPADDRRETVVQISVRPSRLVGLLKELRTIEPSVAVQAHAGNGVLIARLQAADVGQVLRERLHPIVRRVEGNLVVLATPDASLPRDLVWGAPFSSLPIMESVKKQFDPQDLLNPGRFIYRAQ